jgi:hypothetical protein
MSKAIDATCSAGIVLAGALPVPTATKLCQGVGPSSGVLILDEDKQTYIADTSGDLKTTLGKIATALSQIATALTAIDAKPTGTLPPAPAAAAAIAQITAVQVELTALKEVLK